MPSSADRPSPLLVSPAEAGMKLLRFLERRLGESAPRSMLYKWLRTGQVRVNKGRSKAHDVLAEGDAVRIPPFAVPRILKEPGTVDFGSGLTLLAREGDVLVLNKAAGLASQPGGGDSVSARLAAAFEGSAFVPAPAHRLDRHTSGLMVAGLSHLAQQGLHALIRDGGMVKEYLVWVCGSIACDAPLLLCDTLFIDRFGDRELVAARPECGATRPLEKHDAALREMPETATQSGGDACRDTLPGMMTDTRAAMGGHDAQGSRASRASHPNHGGSPVARGDAGHGSRTACAVAPAARLAPKDVPEALLAASPLLGAQGATLLLVRLFTGRKHQIRVQLASRGRPVIGDGRYGGPRFERMLLHAHALSFSAPGNGEPLAFSALPDWPAPFLPDETAVAVARERMRSALG